MEVVMVVVVMVAAMVVEVKAVAAMEVVAMVVGPPEAAEMAAAKAVVRWAAKMAVVMTAAAATVGGLVASMGMAAVRVPEVVEGLEIEEEGPLEVERPMHKIPSIDRGTRVKQSPCNRAGGTCMYLH